MIQPFRRFFARRAPDRRLLEQYRSDTYEMARRQPVGSLEWMYLRSVSDMVVAVGENVRGKQFPLYARSRLITKVEVYHFLQVLQANFFAAMDPALRTTHEVLPGQEVVPEDLLWYETAEHQIQANRARMARMRREHAWLYGLLEKNRVGIVDLLHSVAERMRWPPDIIELVYQLNTTYHSGGTNQHAYQLYHHALTSYSLPFGSRIPVVAAVDGIAALACDSLLRAWKRLISRTPDADAQ